MTASLAVTYTVEPTTKRMPNLPSSRRPCTLAYVQWRRDGRRDAERGRFRRTFGLKRVPTVTRNTIHRALDVVMHCRRRDSSRESFVFFLFDRVS